MKLFKSFNEFLNEESSDAKPEKFTDEFGEFVPGTSSDNISFLEGLVTVNSKKYGLEIDGPYSSKGIKELEVAPRFDPDVFNSSFFILYKKDHPIRAAVEMLTDPDSIKDILSASMDKKYPDIYLHIKKDKESPWKFETTFQAQAGDLGVALLKFFD